MPSEYNQDNLAPELSSGGVTATPEVINVTESTTLQVTAEDGGGGGCMLSGRPGPALLWLPIALILLAIIRRRRPAVLFSSFNAKTQRREGE